VKVNSVFRFGTPFVTSTDSNAAPAGGRYPYVVPGTGADTRTPGEIVWRPGNALGFPGTDGTNMTVGMNQDALQGWVTPGFPVQDPANWSFTIIADQMIGGVITPGQSTETTLVIKVQPNHAPSIGALTTINVPAINAGVNTGAGTATAPNIGRPAIQEPVASDTATPGTPSKWIWAIGTPGSAGSDTNIADPNTNAVHGHQDAIQVFFGSAPYNTVNGIGVLTVGNYPTFDTTGNYPAVDTTGTIPNGFYNPWLGAVPTPATYTVAWAPIRIQYQLGRYLYCFTGQANPYNFPLKVEDQYTLSSTNAVNIFPIFGTVKFFNSRFRFRLDDGADESLAGRRGEFTSAGNFITDYAGGASFPRYTFNYLPIGVSSSAANDEIVTSSGTSTYSSNLFGRANPTVSGSPASGYGSYAGGYYAPGDWAGSSLLTAGNWHTLDGLNSNAGAGSNGARFLSPGNPLNSLFNAPAKAAGVTGTSAGAAKTYTQFQGANASPIQVAIPASPYSNNEADAKVIPSNSPYLFNVSGLFDPWGGWEGLHHDAITQLRYPDFPHLGGYSVDTGRLLPFHWAYGCAQSEVNYQRVHAGHPVLFSLTDPVTVDVDGFVTAAPSAMLRLSFTWPTMVTNTAGDYPVAGTANIWGLTDVMQVATPNMGGRARFFFTGNYIGTSESDPTNYWKLGFASSTGLTFTSTGATVAASQPIHVPTNSLWVPAEANGHFNLLNTLTTPAGGSGYTDIPFAGIRGYVANTLRPTIAARPDAITPDYVTTMGWACIGVGARDNNSYQQNWVRDNHVNPALLNTAANDSVFFLWMKQDSTGLDAYGTYAGSYLNAGSLYAAGGHTTAPAFDMYNAGARGLTDTQAQISFSEIGTQLGGVNQTINSGIGMGGWAITQFEQLRALAAAPAQYGNAPRARLVDPTMVSTGSDNTLASFDLATAPTNEGIVSNSLIVYAIQNRGTDAYGNSLLGEAGIEPGSPVLAQWWNAGHADVVASSGFPAVLGNYTTSFLPAGYQEVIELKHNFVGKLMYPNVGTTSVQKVILSTGIIAPKGNTLLNNAIPVVTPVRQLAINDMKINTATGTTAIGTKLDIFNGTADLSANGLTYGTPLGGIPSFKLVNGNGLAASDYRIHGDSNVQITWQPGVNDLRSPSGYIVTIYNVANNTISGGRPVHIFQMGHKGGIGAIQTLNLPSFRALDPLAPGAGTNYNAYFAVKVRNVWMNGTEGPDSKGFDMAKEPFASRYPMAWADCLSGVFAVNYGVTAPAYAPIVPSPVVPGSSNANP
jgi:hypothetical protein